MRHLDRTAARPDHTGARPDHTGARPDHAGARPDRAAAALTRRGFAATSLIALSALTACSSGSGTETGGSSDGGAGAGASDGAGWPRTVTVGSGTITLDAAPQRVVAVSTETADMALQLVGADRVVAVPDGLTDPHSSNQSELAGKVEDTVKGAPSPDPEQILGLDPDLVLITERHDGEKTVGESLSASGVPCAAFSSSDFATPEKVAAALTAMGRLLGAEDAAAAAQKDMTDRIETVETQVEGADDAPRTLGLFARGPKQMLFAAHSSTSTLIELAAGTSIAEEKNWDASPSADPEVIIDAAPDVILVQDFHGAGLGPFQSLLKSPALAEVPAIAEDNVHLVDAMTTSGTAGTRLGEGLEQIAAILHPDLVSGKD